MLAIDLYNKAYQGGSRPVREVDREFSGSCGENAWKALPLTQKLLAAARRASVPVIYTTRHVDTAGVHSTNRNMKKERDDIYDIKAELAPQPGELVIYKERASGFFGTPLIAHLQKLRINSLIICGESTSGCVRASTVDAYSYGFHNVPGGGMHLRSLDDKPQSESVRPASQIRRRDAYRGSSRASRRLRRRSAKWPDCHCERAKQSNHASLWIASLRRRNKTSRSSLQQTEASSPVMSTSAARKSNAPEFATAYYFLEGLTEIGVEYLFCNFGTDHAPIIEEMAHRKKRGEADARHIALSA